VVLPAIWFLFRGNGSEGTPAEGSSNKLVQKEAKIHRFIPVFNAIDPEYHQDSYMQSCFQEKLQVCIDTHLKDSKDKFSTGASFLETIQSLAELPDNELFDNCLADDLRTCSDLAIKHKVESSSDVSSCDSYADPVLKQSCYNDAYPRLAVEKDNPMLCNQLADPYYSKYCMDTYNTKKSVKTKDISWCGRMSEDYMKENCKNAFYASVAIDSKDPEFCKSAGDKDQVASCVSQFARGVGYTDPAQCKIVSSYATYFANEKAVGMAHDECVSFVAVKLQEKITPETKDAELIASAKALC
jgi:hypothetical protein